MKNRQNQILAVIALCVILAVYFFYRRDQDIPPDSGNTLSGPTCMLTGEMKTRRANPQGFEALGNMIRLRFEASTPEECQRMAAQYCHNKQMEGYVPDNLKATFRANPNAGTAYEFSVYGNCVFDNVTRK